jgi:hypothetical protein
MSHRIDPRPGRPAQRRRAVKSRTLAWVSVGILGTLMALLVALSQERTVRLNFPAPAFSSLDTSCTGCAIPDPGILGSAAPLPSPSP